ncbi:MAG TPA: hypothetical protein PLS69_01450, partial [Terricaulis sp.]|nr:hypothetical protein [Terricaulis sp.]
MSKHAVLLGAITVIAFNAGGAHAQNVASTNMIVVTATREAALARDLPQSVAVISGDALRAADGAEDLVMLLPGVQAAISNGSQTTFQIRGVGAVDHQARLALRRERGV